MNVFDSVASLQDEARKAVATIGNFDGLHSGHRAIVGRVLARARATRGRSLLITFDPHPLRLLAPERAPLMLATRRQKLALIEAAGIDNVLIVPFTADFASVTAAQFVREFLSSGLGIREI